MEYKSLDVADYESLMDRYHINSLLAKVVSSLQYNPDELDSFFNPRHYGLLKHDSFEEFNKVINDIIDNDRGVFVFGDYDCDGICATSIMVSLLNKLKIRNGYYIPNRFTEGYGLNLSRLKQAHEKGYEVLITVDNGVAANDALKWARDNGMTTIVTDHHVINERVEADVLCHPSLLPPDYRHLCGAGLAYCLADYLSLADEKLKVLAMIATIADVMELKGFNLQLVREGLQLIRQHRFPHLEMLLEEDVSHVDETDVSFKIAPRINSAGRMADIANPNNVVSFLLTDSMLEASHLAVQINQVNSIRKNLTSQQYLLVRQSYDPADDFLIVYLEGLHEGIVGSLASRLSSETNKPCIIFTSAAGLLKGSGRGIDGLDLEQLLNGFRDRSVAFGGHKGACGITIAAERLPDLRDYIKSNYKVRQASKNVVEVGLNELSRENLEELFSYKPFGQGRKLPLFKLTAGPLNDLRKLKNEQQLKWQLTDFLSVLSFSDNEGYDSYLGCGKLHFIGEIRENRFRDRISYVMYPEEIRKL